MGSWLGSGTSFRGFASEEPAPWGVSELAFRVCGTATAGATRKGTSAAGLAVTRSFHQRSILPSNPEARNWPIPPHPPTNVQGNGDEKNIPRRATEAVLVVAESIVVGFNQSLASWLGYFAD